MSTNPSDYGTLVFEGRVFPLGRPGGEPTYLYERRVAHDATTGGSKSTSFTRDQHGAVLIETATHDADWGLREFTEYQFQLGEVGRLFVRDGVAEFHLTHGSTERVATERIDLPVVVGPTLYGFVELHRAELLAGQRVPFRFAVLSRLETIGFELTLVDARAANQLRICMKATSPLIGLLVDPLYITYERDGQLVALDGRVPTKVRQGDEWADFDAHVEYRNTLAHFQ